MEQRLGGEINPKRAQFFRTHSPCLILLLMAYNDFAKRDQQNIMPITHIQNNTGENHFLVVFALLHKKNIKSTANRAVCFATKKQFCTYQKNQEVGMQKKRRAISRKACDNCRKAHSCCSEPRPCKRCVGLELECIDTPSKKRGRKRKYNLDADPEANLHSDDDEDNEPLTKQPKLMVSMDRAIPVHMHNLFPPQQQQTFKIALPVLRPKGAILPQQQSHPMMAMQQVPQQQQQYLVAPVAQQQYAYPPSPYNSNAYQQQQFVSYQQQQVPQHTPPMIIPQHSLPPIPSPTQLQQQQQQQQQAVATSNSKHHMNNNALSMLLQSSYSEVDAKRDILQFLMIEGLTFETCLTLESNPSCNESYVYRNLMNEEAYGTFWSTLEQFISSKHFDSPEQSQKYDKVKKLFDIGHKGPTGLCFMHTECAKHFLLERLQDYVKRKTSRASVVTIAMGYVCE